MASRWSLVTFHEVGAVDSIVDIVAAAQLISLIRADRWTSTPLPIGSGRINSAHGVLPVPAPAAAFLLQGLPVIDDGVPGERVTPTGAALARYLINSRALSNGRILPDVAQRHRIWRRTLPGISNCSAGVGVRRSDARTASADSRGSIDRRQLGVITFEVDDQRQRIWQPDSTISARLHDVFDVTQTSVVSKKGRMAAHVQILVSPLELENAIVACFEETTTIGLRYQLTEGAVLRAPSRDSRDGGAKN